jgi:biopolymer transport protein ExbD
MAMSVGSDGGDEEEVTSSINTTPLVDVMLVLLIIFLITIPVVTHTVPVKLPDDRNVPTITKPENINISVNKDGDVFWNEKIVKDNATLLKMMEKVAVIKPQPEIHIRGDQDARYEYIGRVVYDAQRASIFRIGFITQPPPRGGY